MTPADFRLICTALGFTAVVMKGRERGRNSARRALGFARLIEDFCNYVRACEAQIATPNAEASRPEASTRRPAPARAKKK